jgi:hypothetical protein
MNLCQRQGALMACGTPRFFCWTVCDGSCTMCSKTRMGINWMLAPVGAPTARGGSDVWLSVPPAADRRR